MGSRRRRRGRRSAPLALIVLLLAALAAYAWWSQQQPAPAAPPQAAATGTLRVHYVNVGQGDGAIWELPDGSLVVYDCGPPAASAEENPMVRYLRDALGRAPGATIHALVASHGHLDHVGGCDGILATYRVLHVYEAWYEGDDAPESYRRFQAAIRAEGAQVHTLGATTSLDDERPFGPGDAIDLPAGSGASATLLWPSSFAGGWDAIGPSSLVVRLVHGASAFCFQGDIEEAQERALAGSRVEARCDAYLVGHHGSRSASTAAWLARMQPRVAVASFGDNAFGHPTAEALCRLQQAGAQAVATQRGDVVLASDGAGVRLERGQAETRDYCAPGADYWA